MVAKKATSTKTSKGIGHFMAKNKMFFCVIAFSFVLMIFAILGIVDQVSMFLINTCSVGPLSVFTIVSLVLVLVGVIGTIAAQIAAKGGEEN